MVLYTIILILSFAFIFYGVSFFTNSGMKEEFERYRLGHYRKLVGCLQLLGGWGLLIGLVWQPALIIASGGLALLMMMGLGVRLKMNDGFWKSLPSFIFMLLNGYIFFVAFVQ
jgi:hypothetical protein